MKKLLKSRYSVYGLFILAVALVFIYRFIFPSPMSAYSNTDIFMGSNVTVSVYAENEELAKEISDNIFGKIDELDKAISANNNKSELYALNNSGESDNASDLLDEAIRKSIDINKKSENAFSPLLYNLTSLWGIGTDSQRVPSDDEIKKALQTADIKNISVSAGKIKLSDGAKLDLGGAGKGMACDIALRYLKQNKISGAVMIGGSVLVYGEQPSKKPYTVSLRNPFGEITDSIGTISLYEGTVSTSGSYEKYFEQDGKIYHHIFDTETGYPVETKLKSVTVICKDGFVGDALSTAIFAMNPEKGLELLNQYDADAILVDENKNIYMTDGVSFEITDENFKQVSLEEFCR